MRRREDLPFLFDVTTEVEGAPASESRSGDGPAQVATDSYRKGWEAIWGAERASSGRKRAN